MIVELGIEIRQASEFLPCQPTPKKPTRKGADFSYISPNHQDPRLGNSQNLVEDPVKDPPAVGQQVRLGLQDFGETVEQAPGVP